MWGGIFWGKVVAHVLMEDKSQPQPYGSIVFQTNLRCSVGCKTKRAPGAETRLDDPPELRNPFYQQFSTKGGISTCLETRI